MAFAKRNPVVHSANVSRSRKTSGESSANRRGGKPGSRLPRRFLSNVYWSGDIQWCVGPNQASGVRCLVSGSEFWHL